MYLTDSSNQFQNYESKFSRIVWPIRTKFRSHKQCESIIGLIFPENIGFVVSELDVGSGEQDKQQTHHMFSQFLNLQI